MKLRKLLKKDAPYMLEWMHDASVVEYMGKNFAEKTLSDCEAFIEWSNSDNDNLNLAIVDDNDEYMGTVSLKEIDREEGNAEFAITIRKSAMGKGFSRFGMSEIIKKGFDELGLKFIYWCVSKVNERAVRFYDKNGYKRVDFDSLKVKTDYTDEECKSFYWYIVDGKV
ncbi:MAG: GNAT family N-acetyltransferase [Lachnospiraceae bacterium]|nr:GNAT family N-acetyltransferase [Lachnospiraceae bacterium]